MTYSIIARDPDTGCFGVAVQSHWFAVGTVVPWARAGVGAVATQAHARAEYGPELLDLLATGASAPDALAELIARDDAAAVRQVAVVDAQGRAAVHTGGDCIAEASHQIGEGDGVAAQANIMRTPGVPAAMLDAYRQQLRAKAPMGARLIAALAAAERAGGDLRGSQSAALLVVGQEGDDIDLRVDDHPDPVTELARLDGLQLAYTHLERGDEAVAAGDTETAARAYASAREHAPTQPEVAFWSALAPAMMGDVEASITALADLPDPDGRWAELLRRLADAKIVDRDLLARLLPPA
ncbi:MAG: hypothetical protein JWL76_484 [Thermoleophilia bacterium]|nr:hypothetical protein [Thermoleophilia bacterium]